MAKTSLSMLMLLCCGSLGALQKPGFNVIVVATRAADHSAMIAAARPFLTQLGTRHGFAVDFTQDTSQIDDAFLAKYRVMVQLHLAPFEIPPMQQGAFQRFIDQGKGWVGIHAAGLTGRQFQDAKAAYWQWFEGFFGGGVYSPHPAFQKATVVVEDRTHPATRNLPARFQISDEWYEFGKSPRPNVRVLATVDESTYSPKKPMGDHPVVWSNEKYGRMIYILMGHDPGLFQNPSFTTLLRDAILWAGNLTRHAGVR